MSSFNNLVQLLAEPLMFRSPAARAEIHGSSQYPDLNGEVLFYRVSEGTLVMADIDGLPYRNQDCSGGIFGFHIHEGKSCTGNVEDPFADTKSHYNPHKCPHPYHAGDLPPLFGNQGHACMALVTNRFTVQEILGLAVVIHDKPDDFTTQPSGNSGMKIACGIIKAI